MRVVSLAVIAGLAALCLGSTAQAQGPIKDGDPSVALGTSEMTLMELTAAYAGVAANQFPVVPTAFTAEEPGWLESLFDGKDSLSGSQHVAHQEKRWAA